MFNVYSIENQNFYLNNSIISGIQNVQISYDNNIGTSLAVNDGNLNYFISKPIAADLSLDYLLIKNDPLIKYVTGNAFSGKIEYGNKFFTFSSGYLTNYSINYALGEYPKVSTRISIFGELGNTSGAFSYKPINFNNSLLPIGDINYVNLNLNEANNNRLESFNLDIEVSKEPIYTIGNYLPDEVIIKYPININLNFNFSMSEYDQEKITNIFNQIATNTLDITFKEYNTSKDLLKFNFSNLTKTSRKLDYSLNNDAKLNINLITQITNNANINIGANNNPNSIIPLSYGQDGYNLNSDSSLTIQTDPSTSPAIGGLGGLGGL